jgi:hypothetical protein
MKIIHIVAKVLLSLIFVLPAFGLLGIFPPPTRDMYHTDASYTFIQMMMNSAQYIDYMMVGVLLLAFVALWTKREALGALLALPITANVIGFHLFLDGGLMNAGSIPSLLMLAINVYLLYKNREVLKTLLKPHSA